MSQLGSVIIVVAPVLAAMFALLALLPRGQGTVVGLAVASAAAIGTRFHPSTTSMDDSFAGAMRSSALSAFAASVVVVICCAFLYQLARWKFGTDERQLGVVLVVSIGVVNVAMIVGTAVFTA